MQLSSKTSGVSLHISKHKGSDASINGLQRHNEREPGSRHSNKRIDDSRTADNVILKRSDGTYYEQVSAIIDRNRDGGLKGVRKDAVRMCEATVQLSGQVLDRSDAEQERVLRQSYDWLKQTFGEDNIVSATIHKDETNMHMHVDIVPITADHKLSAKTVVSKSALQRYQTDFLRFLQQTEPALNFIRGSSASAYNGLPQDVYEQLQSERQAMLAEVEEREIELDNRETSLDSRETALNARESNLNALDVQLRQKQQKLLKTQNTLSERVSALKEREQAVTEREQHQKSTQIDIERQQQDLTKRLNKAIIVDKGLNRKYKDIMVSTDKLERIKADNQQVLDGITSATDTLRQMMDKGLRLTATQKRDLHERIERHKPLTPTSAPALERDVQEFMDSLNTLQQDKGGQSLL